MVLERLSCCCKAITVLLFGWPTSATADSDDDNDDGYNDSYDYAAESDDDGDDGWYDSDHDSVTPGDKLDVDERMRLEGNWFFTLDPEQRMTYDMDTPLENWKNNLQPNLDRRLDEILRTPTLQSDAKKCWNELGGEQLEPPLRSGAIALLDAQWLLNFLASQGMERRQVPCRQELPVEAFLNCDLIIQSTTNDGIPIMTLSYCWLHPDHPDPKCSTLELLGNECINRFQQETTSPLPCLGIFWDYVSLHQHPDPSCGMYRNEQEEALFREGLESLAKFYAHRHIMFCQVTKLPEGYPEAYNLPENGNTVEYSNRGWTTVESALASIAKNDYGKGFHNLSDPLGDHWYNLYDRRDGNAPITPQRMADKLEGVSFTNAKEDRPLVRRLYTNYFQEYFGSATELDYTSCHWPDGEFLELARVIAEGYIPRMESLSLKDNILNGKVCGTLADTLRESTIIQKLQSLDLGGCELNDTTIKEFAEVIVRIPQANLSDNPDVGRKGWKAIADAANPMAAGWAILEKMKQIQLQHFTNRRKTSREDERGTTAVRGTCVNETDDFNVRLRDLSLDFGGIGTGVKILILPLLGFRLERLSMASCGLGVSACRSLAASITRRGGESRVKLKYLNLTNNLFGDKGVQVMAEFLIRVEEINLSGCNLSPVACCALANAATHVKESCHTSEATDPRSKVNCLRITNLSQNTEIERHTGSSDKRNDTCIDDLCRFCQSCPEFESLTLSFSLDCVGEGHYDKEKWLASDNHKKLLRCTRNQSKVDTEHEVVTYGEPAEE